MPFAKVRGGTVTLPPRLINRSLMSFLSAKEKRSSAQVPCHGSRDLIYHNVAGAQNVPTDKGTTCLEIAGIELPELVHGCGRFRIDLEPSAVRASEY